MLNKKSIIDIKGLKFSKNLLGIENFIEGNHKNLYKSVRGVINEITSIDSKGFLNEDDLKNLPVIKNFIKDFTSKDFTSKDFFIYYSYSFIHL